MTTGEMLALGAILSPIIIIASPILIPTFIKGYVKNKMI
jgi:hypothetical protein